MNQLTDPLQSLLKSAARNLPVATGETETFRRRFESAGATTIIICDVSGSMDEKAGSRRKIEHLHEAGRDSWDAISGAKKLLEFSSGTREISGPDQLSQPSGGTALHLAISVATVHRPAHTLVNSDGQPDDEAAALAAADVLSGTIDVIFCGSDSDLAAIAFMQRLARTGCGRVVVADVVKHASGQSLKLGCRQLLLPKE